MILHQIIHLQAKIEESDEVRKIKLKSNKKDPETMQKLSFALEKLNNLTITDNCSIGCFQVFFTKQHIIRL
jgi:hypothetical protein